MNKEIGSNFLQIIYILKPIQPNGLLVPPNGFRINGSISNLKMIRFQRLFKYGTRIQIVPPNYLI